MPFISIIITFINFVGGLIVGIMNSQGTIQDIMQIYTTSTIGDGLVSQIPALLISVATGMIVTRSASENSLSEDLTSQFLAQPRVLMTAGAAAACLCLIPGFPVFTDPHHIVRFNRRRISPVQAPAEHCG